MEVAKPNAVQLRAEIYRRMTEKEKQKQKKQQSHAHHYVPRWYQKRFLPQGQTNFYLMDLHPERIEWSGGSHQLKALRRRGPDVCFYEDDLYTVKLGSWTTDQIERSFFGMVDSRGRAAVAHFAEFDGIKEPTTWTAGGDLPPYMDAQKFRTPRGLDLIKQRRGSRDDNLTLLEMQGKFEFTTMWMEGVWEIVRARKTQTKFIVSDDPVTFYCKSVFPSEWKYPNEISLKQIGTRTLFPLGLDSCLIITHVQFVRNPWSTPTEFRINARSYQQTLKHLGHIQFGRELEEDEVLRINYILKKRAVRYIASAEEEWLYPERHVSTDEWAKLDDDWFLFPHLWRVPFSGGISVGYRDGSAAAWDEYGRRPWQRGYQDESQRDREFETCEKAKCEWAKRRIGKSRARTDERIGRDVEDKMVDDYLRAEGLLQPTTTTPAQQ